MALYTGRILMRGGNEANFDPDKMMPREWAISTDKRIVRICVSPGVCIRMATYDAFEEDMAKVEEILQTSQTIEEAVTRINENVNQKANAVMEYADQTEQNKNIVEQSTAVVIQKAEEVEENTQTVKEKSEDVSENTKIVLEKAEELSNAAENAKTSEDNAKESEENSLYNYKMSKSYAVGDTGERIGEDTDNSKYYYENAKAEADRAKEEADKAADIAGGDYVTNSQIKEYSLIKDTGCELALSIDSSNYVMTIDLKNASGNVISSKAIDFPIESMVVNAAYESGIITLTLQNGNSLPVDVSSLVSGLVKDTFTIAGINMKDDITAVELKAALGISKDDITTALGFTPPSVDTKNTAGSTNSSSKLFLVGATSQASNPQTYSHDTAYVGSDGHLYSNSKKVVNLSDSQSLTNKTYNGYTLGAACAKGVATTVASGNTSLVTSGAVYTAIDTAIGDIGTVLDAINGVVI